MFGAILPKGTRIWIVALYGNVIAGLIPIQDHFCVSDVILNDGLGAMAADSVETLLKLLGNQELSRIWKELTDDEC